MQEEFETANTSIFKGEIVTHELMSRPIEVAQNMINFMTSTSKSELQVLKVDDKTKMTTL